MKIIHVVPVYAPAWQFGGPVQSISRTCESLTALGHQVDVITTNAGNKSLKKGELGIPIKRNGVNVSYFETFDKGATIVFSRLNDRRVNKMINGADIIHFSTIWQPWGVKIQRIANRLNKPLIQSTRGALSEYSFAKNTLIKSIYYQFVEKRYLNKCALIHVTGSYESKEVARLNLSPEIHVVGNPLDERNLHSGSKNPKPEKKGGDAHGHTRKLLICGRINRKKGLDLIPQLLAELKHYSWTLDIVGESDDNSLDELQTAFGKLGLHERIKWHTYLPAIELSNVYTESNLLLLPSRHENFGNVVIEALAHGCQIAISDQTGVSEELIESGKIDYGVVLPRELNAWVKWMTSWFERPSIRAEESAQWVQANYSPISVAKKMERMYEKVLNKRNQS